MSTERGSNLCKHCMQNASRALGLIGSRFSLPPSGKRVMQKKEMLSFSFELGSR